MNATTSGRATPIVGAATPDVITPDAVGLELPVATVGSRGIAWFLDALVLFAGLLLVGVAMAILGTGGFVPGWAGIAVLLLLTFAWQFGYPIGFEVGLRGRTPGKAAMGLRVVTIEGAPVGFRHAAIRALVGLLELLLTLGAVAVVSSLISRRGQRLGDLAAGTVVVRERRVGGAPQAVSFVPPPGLEEYTARLDTSSVGPATYALIRDTLRRAPRLPPDTRGNITAQVATHVLGRVTPAPPAGVPAEVWLWCVAASVQRRRQAAPAPGGGSAQAFPGGYGSAPPAAPPGVPSSGPGGGGAAAQGEPASTPGAGGSASPAAPSSEPSAGGAAAPGVPPSTPADGRSTPRRQTAEGAAERRGTDEGEGTGFVPPD